jgi:hypothetical protein
MTLIYVKDMSMSGTRRHTDVSRKWPSSAEKESSSKVRKTITSPFQDKVAGHPNLEEFRLIDVTLYDPR